MRCRTFSFQVQSELSSLISRNWEGGIGVKEVSEFSKRVNEESVNKRDDSTKPPARIAMDRGKVMDRGFARKARTRGFCRLTKLDRFSLFFDQVTDSKC